MNIYLPLLSNLGPLTAVKLIYKRISTPQKRNVREFEEVILERAKKSSIKFKDHELQGYSWGIQNNPIALLIHGWGGHAGNIGALVTMLTARSITYLPVTAFHMGIVVLERRVCLSIHILFRSA